MTEQEPVYRNLSNKEAYYEKYHRHSLHQKPYKRATETAIINMINVSMPKLGNGEFDSNGEFDVGAMKLSYRGSVAAGVVLGDFIPLSRLIRDQVLTIGRVDEVIVLKRRGKPTIAEEDLYDETVGELRLCYPNGTRVSRDLMERVAKSLYEKKYCNKFLLQFLRADSWPASNEDDNIQELPLVRQRQAGRAGRQRAGEQVVLNDTGGGFDLGTFLLRNASAEGVQVHINTGTVNTGTVNTGTVNHGAIVNDGGRIDNYHSRDNGNNNSPTLELLQNISRTTQETNNRTQNMDRNINAMSARRQPPPSAQFDRRQGVSPVLDGDGCNPMRALFQDNEDEVAGNNVEKQGGGENNGNHEDNQEAGRPVVETVDWASETGSVGADEVPNLEGEVGVPPVGGDNGGVPAAVVVVTALQVLPQYFQLVLQQRLAGNIAQEGNVEGMLNHVTNNPNAIPNVYSVDIPEFCQIMIKSLGGQVNESTCDVGSNWLRVLTVDGNDILVYFEANPLSETFFGVRNEEDVAVFCGYGPSLLGMVEAQVTISDSDDPDDEDREALLWIATGDPADLYFVASAIAKDVIPKTGATFVSFESYQNGGKMDLYLKKQAIQPLVTSVKKASFSHFNTNEQQLFGLVSSSAALSFSNCSLHGDSVALLHNPQANLDLHFLDEFPPLKLLATGNAHIRKLGLERSGGYCIQLERNDLMHIQVLVLKAIARGYSVKLREGVNGVTGEPKVADFVLSPISCDEESIDGMLVEVRNKALVVRNKAIAWAGEDLEVSEVNSILEKALLDALNSKVGSDRADTDLFLEMTRKGLVERDVDVSVEVDVGTGIEEHEEGSVSLGDNASTGGDDDVENEDANRVPFPPACHTGTWAGIFNVDSESTWVCEVCRVRNKNSDEACQACEIQPGTSGGGGASASTTAAAIAPTVATGSIESGGDSFGAASTMGPGPASSSIGPGGFHFGVNNSTMGGAVEAENLAETGGDTDLVAEVVEDDAEVVNVDPEPNRQWVKGAKGQGVGKKGTRVEDVDENVGIVVKDGKKMISVKFFGELGTTTKAAHNLYKLREPKKV